MTEPVIQSLLDTDLYKFTMMQVVFEEFPSSQAVYRFECRNTKPNAFLIQSLEKQLLSLGQLSLSASDRAFLETFPFFKAEFLDYLEHFSFNPDYVQLSTEDDQLKVTIEGPWLDTILFEVPLLAIISELYGQSIANEGQLSKAVEIAQQKIDFLASIPENDFGFVDFGTRRRFSHAWHKQLLDLLLEQVPSKLKGTSNVLFAKELNLPAVGTMAHEYIQACQVLAPDLHKSQQFALETWLKVYPHDLSIALTDTLGFDVFIKEFNESLAKQYKGLRQDSGDPVEWTLKALQMYKDLGLNAENKIFVYSDRLTFKKAYELFQRFHSLCRPSFGIGTYVTNDVGIEPLDGVIKLHRLNGLPVVKLSDSPGKAVCDDETYLIEFKKKLGL